MAEDLEKYRGLYNIVKNPSKVKLFGNSGLFGGPGDEDHKVLEIFADWIYSKQIENGGLIPITVNSSTFISFLKSQEENKENNELIKKIEELHQEGIIQDEPLENNTLRQFGIVLDNLGVFDSTKRPTDQYNIALKNIGSMQPLAEKKVTAKDTPAKSGQAKPGIVGKVSPVDAKIPEKKEVTNTSTDEDGGSYDESEETNLNVNASTSSSTETSTGIQPSTKKEVEKTAEESEALDSANQTPAISVTPIIPVTPATPVTPVSQKPAGITPIITPAITPKTSELEEARMREEKKAIEQPQASATPSIALPRSSKNRGKGRRVVARRGAHGDKVRQVSTKEGPQRVQPDTARNRQTQNAQANAQNEQDNYDNQLTQNARNQQSAEEGADEGSKKKGSLAKKVLTGVGASTVAGGGFFAFLAGDTEAATFAISHASTTFESIISLIHMFIK